MYIPSTGCSVGLLGHGSVDTAKDDNNKNTQVKSEQIESIPQFWSVLNKFASSSNWPHQTVILPGE